MGDERFRDPKVALDRIYTRSGDAGETGLVGGVRVFKDDARIEAYGEVDEANAVVGMVRAELAEILELWGALMSSEATGVEADELEHLAAHAPSLTTLLADLGRVQHQLFNLGSRLATPAPRAGAPTVGDEDVAWLEGRLDDATQTLAPLTSFVLPGGSRLNALLHLARTVTRRAERRTVTLLRDKGCTPLEVRYLNRLSDALFVWGRLAARAIGHDETLWDPNAA